MYVIHLLCVYESVKCAIARGGVDNHSAACGVSGESVRLLARTPRWERQISHTGRQKDTNSLLNNLLCGVVSFRGLIYVLATTLFDRFAATFPHPALQSLLRRPYSYHSHPSPLNHPPQPRRVAPETSSTLSLALCVARDKDVLCGCLTQLEAQRLQSAA